MSAGRAILFSAEMVRALIDGRKSVTRRICPTVVIAEGAPMGWRRRGRVLDVGQSPWGSVGDTLWVKETWAPAEAGTRWRADGELPAPTGGWRSALFMPRERSRMALRIEALRIEALHAIDEADARREGVVPRDGESCVQAYARLWDALNAVRGHAWASNPWVWVIALRRS